MVTRDDDRPTLVALVDPALCVSCGICAGSCAPMGVGPAGRDGRDQLTRVRTFLGEVAAPDREVVVVACSHGAGGAVAGGEVAGAPVYGVDCAGNLHSSVVELLVRGGTAGVMVVACPGRDCWNREGPRWTRERLFDGREAELQERVDRRRVSMVQLGLGERAGTERAVTAFREHIRSLDAHAADTDLEVLAECVVEGVDS